LPQCRSGLGMNNLITIVAMILIGLTIILLGVQRAR
jgi:hypothetical protein